jgi:hypothetical protein
MCIHYDPPTRATCKPTSSYQPSDSTSFVKLSLYALWFLDKFNSCMFRPSGNAINFVYTVCVDAINLPVAYMIQHFVSATNLSTHFISVQISLVRVSTFTNSELTARQRIIHCILHHHRKVQALLSSPGKGDIMKTLAGWGISQGLARYRQNGPGICLIQRHLERSVHGARCLIIPYMPGRFSWRLVIHTSSVCNRFRDAAGWIGPNH